MLKAQGELQAGERSLRWLTSWSITLRSQILSVSSVMGLQINLASSGNNGAHRMRSWLFYSTTGRAVRQSWMSRHGSGHIIQHARAQQQQTRK